MSETAVICLQSRSLFASRRVALTSSELTNTLTFGISVDGAQLSVVAMLNIAGAAPKSITIFSATIGAHTATEMVRVGQTGCERSEWMSETAVMCLPSHSISGTRRVSVTSGVMAGSVTGMVSADIGFVMHSRLGNLVSHGSEVVSVVGFGFGLFASCFSARVGVSGAEASGWMSDTCVSCRSPEGMWRSWRVSLTLGSQTTSLTRTLSYEAPIVSGSYPANTLFAFRSLVTIIGDSFYVEDGSLRAQMGNTACEASLWMSETSLRCRVSAGNSASALAMVTNARMPAAASECVSYDVPAVSSESMRNVPPAQHTRAILNGVDLGSIDQSTKVRHGMTAGESSAWISGTAVVSLSPGHRNLGFTKATVLTVGETAGTTTKMFSADANIVVSVIGLTNANVKEPSSSIVLHVSKLTEMSSALRVGDTGCQHTHWVSTTSLQGRAVSGPQGTRAFTVTMGATAGSLSSAFTFYAGVVSSFKESNVGDAAQKPVLVHGGGLGKWSMSSNNRMGHTGCESTVWYSETTVHCRAARLVSGSQTVTVTSGPALGSASSMISMDIGIITQPRCHPDETLALSHGCDSSKCSSLGNDCCAPGDEEATCKDGYLVIYLGQDCKYTCCPPDSKISSWCFHGYSNLRLPGGQSITVFGAGLPMNGYTVSVRLGGSASEHTVWASQSAVICKSAEGQKRTWRVMMSTGILTASLSEAISFDSPVASGARASNSIPSAERVVRILGHNLATEDASILARLGGTHCEMSSWLSETSLKCRVSTGKAATKSAEVTMVNKWAQVTDAASFDHAVVSSICERNLVSAYQRTISVSGANMGFSDPTLSVRSGNTACELSIWLSDTSMISLATRSPAGRTMTAVMTMSSQSGSQSSVFSFDGVAVRDVDWQDVYIMPLGVLAVSKGNIAGGARDASLSIRGSEFMMIQRTGMARIGHTGCEATVWGSESQLTCRSVNSAARGTRPIIVTGGQVLGSVSEMLSTDGVDFTMIQLSNLQLRRGLHVVTFRSGLVQNFSPAGRLGMTGVETTRWTADSGVVCRNAEGVSRTRRVMLTASKCVSTLSEAVSYDRSSIFGAETANAAPNRGTVSVLGSNFAQFDNTPGSRFGKTGCQMSAWVSGSSLKCRSPTGIGQSVSASVTLGRTVSEDMSASLSYDTSSLSSVFAPNAAPYQGIMVTMAGAGIASFAPSQAARLALTASDLSRWMSDSSIMALTASSTGKTQRVSLTAALQPSTLTEAFSLSGPILEFTVRLVNVQTYGGFSMQLTVYNYGPLAQSIGLRLGSASESTQWISSSGLVTKFASGFGRAYFTALTTGSQVGSVTNQLSFDVPILNCITHRYTELEPGTGRNDCEPHKFNYLPFIDTIVTLHGSRFASVPVSPNAVVGGTSCATTTWISDSSVRCHVMTIGKVGTLPARVSIQSQFGEITGVFSSTVPIISLASLSNVRAIGKTVVTMHGTNLGPAALTFTIRSGSTQTSATFWVSDTSMPAHPAAGITRSDALVCISVTGFAVTSVSVLSYDAQLLIGPAHRYQVNAPHTGSFSISMSGANFGENMYSQHSRMGNSAGEASMWTSDTTVSCAKPSGTQNLAGVTSLTIQEQTGSISQTFSVDVPEVKALFHANLPGHMIGMRFTVFGEAMDCQHASAKISIGGSNCLATQWLSHSTIACKHSIGTGDMLGLVFTAGLQGKASMSNLFSYDLAFLMMNGRGANRPPGTAMASLGIIPRQPDLSARELDLSGTNLLISYTGALKLGVTVTTSTLWRSDSSVCARVAAGIGANLLSVVTVSRQVGCTTNLFTYDSSRITGSAPYNMRQLEGAKENSAILLFGRDFGMHMSQQIRMGESQCEMSAWVSDTLLACRRSAGIAGQELYLTLSLVAHYRNTLQASHSYDNPVITDAAERLDEDQKQDLITLHGHSFGQCDYSLNAQVEQYGCTATTWLADTSLVCKLRPGFKAQEVPFASIRSGKICRQCARDETLIKCGNGSPGYCWICEPCGPGFFRDCFPSEYTSSGECLPCQNEGLPIGDRFYKDIVGNAQTQCSQCSLCGGRNQDGTEYEVRRCTRDADTQCAACQPCTSPQIRVGCGGDTEGECAEIAPGVNGVLATATAKLNGRNLSPYLHETRGPIVMKMTGDFAGTSMVISELTKLAFTGEMTNLSISTFEPSGEMVDASKRKDVLADLYQESSVRRMWQFPTRRASSNLTRLSLQMVSHIVHCHPPGLILQPPATLTLRLDTALVSQSIYASDLFVYSWDRSQSRWRRIASPGDYLNTTNISIGIRVSNFSTFVAMVPVDIEPPLSSDDLVVPAVVITLLVLGSISVLCCWWQREFILVKAGVRSREQSVEKLHASPTRGLEVYEYSPHATSNRSYYSSPSPSSRVSRRPLSPSTYDRNEHDYARSSVDAYSLTLSSVGRLPSHEMVQASDYASDYEDAEVRRLAEFRLPGAKSTRQVLESSMSSPMMPRADLPLISRSPPRSQSQSPTGIELSVATPRRKFSDVEISHATPAERLHRIEVLRVADDYERPKRRSVSPGGMWDMPPPQPVRREPSPPGTWDSPAMHRRSALGGLAPTMRGQMHHLVASGSDESVFLSPGPAQTRGSPALVPGSAASRMRQRAYSRDPLIEVVEYSDYSHTMDPSPSPGRPGGARLVARQSMDQDENQYFSASEPESFLRERFESLSMAGDSSPVGRVPGWSYSRGDDSVVRQEPSTGHGAVRTSGQRQESGSSSIRRATRSAPRHARGYRTYIDSDSNSDDANPQFVAAATDDRGRASRGRGRGRERGGGNSGNNSDSYAREFEC